MHSSLCPSPSSMAFFRVLSYYYIIILYSLIIVFSYYCFLILFSYYHLHVAERLFYHGLPERLFLVNSPASCTFMPKGFFNVLCPAPADLNLFYRNHDLPHCFPATLMFNIVKVFVSKTPCWFLEIKKLSQFCISISCCSHYHYLLASDCMFAFLFDRGDGSVERKCPHFGKDCHRDRRTGPFWWEISWSTTYHWGYTAHGVQVSCCFFFYSGTLSSVIIR